MRVARKKTERKRYIDKLVSLYLHSIPLNGPEVKFFDIYNDFITHFRFVADKSDKEALSRNTKSMMNVFSSSVCRTLTVSCNSAHKW